jgi:segregation and condensation protein B
MATDKPSLAARIEAVIFAAGEPVPISALAKALSASVADVEQAAASLEQSLAGTGITLVRHNGSLQLATAPELAEDVRRFFQTEQQVSLSSAALETLVVIAYRQPATRQQVEEVRGVNCDSALRTLLRLGLVTELERLEQPGRPITYGTTGTFLHLFGLRSLSDLPPLPEG